MTKNNKEKIDWRQTDRGKKSISKSNRRYTLTKRKDWLKSKSGRRYRQKQLSKEERNRRASKNDLVSTFIKEKRLKKGITQQTLADSVGVGVQTVRNWEFGWTRPQKESIDKLSFVLSFPAEKLIRLIEKIEGEQE